MPRNRWIIPQRPVETLGGRLMEVHAVNTTIGRFVERPRWPRDLRLMLLGAAFAWFAHMFVAYWETLP